MRVLIGDDHLLFRDALRGLVEQVCADAECTEAGTFGELLALCRDGGPFDLVLMDLGMPGWPGFGGISEVRALLAETPLVIVSADDSPADIRTAFDRGATGYIPKTSSAKVMAGALGLVLSGGVYVPSITVAAAAADGDAPRPRDPLTPRQREVYERLREGKPNKVIAHELGLSEGTVKIHVTAIFRALKVTNRTQAVLSAALAS